MILAMDSSDRLGLVSLELPDGTRLTRSSDQPKGHADWLALALAELQAEAGRSLNELERLAVTIGPGSFTGLRVGLAAAKGLVFGTEIPLLPLSSLAVPAAASPDFDRRPHLVCRPARGRDCWAAVFGPGSHVADWEGLADPERLGREAETIAGSAGRVIGRVPDGVDLGLEPLPEPGAAARLEALARLARTGEGLVRGAARDDLLPRYLLEPAVTRPGSAGGGKDRS